MRTGGRNRALSASRVKGERNLVKSRARSRARERRGVSQCGRERQVSERDRLGSDSV